MVRPLGVYMAGNTKNWASIGGTLIGGTAKTVHFASVIPEGKSEKEVFWVDQLFKQLPEYQKINVQIYANEDDSEGNHDVIACKQSDDNMGIQVTELTSELQKSRSALSKYHVRHIINALSDNNVKSELKVAIEIVVQGIEKKKPKFPKPKEVAKIICDKSIKGFSSQIEIEEEGLLKIVYQPLKEGTFYLPNYNNIGVSVNYDSLPRTLDMYRNSVDYLVKKKANSKSPWLVIWSESIWKDFHWLGKELLSYMEIAFSKSQFQKVYFIESMDGEGIFQANIHWHQIKHGRSD